MKISAAIAMYNGEKFIKKQIDSILNQSIKPDEIIICDDCSTDDSVKIVQNYSNIKLFVNDKNVGYAKNFANAILKCKGDIIFLSDQDDVWHNDKIEKCLDIFNKYPDCALVSTNKNIIDANDNIIKYNTNDNVIHVDFFSSLATRRENGCTYAINKTRIGTNQLAKLMNLLITNDIKIHDVPIGHYFGGINKYYYYSGPLINYRVHANNVAGYSLTYKSRGNYEKRVTIAKEYLEIALFYKKSIDTGELDFDNSNKCILNKYIKYCVDRYDWLNNKKHLKGFFHTFINFKYYSSLKRFLGDLYYSVKM